MAPSSRVSTNAGNAGVEGSDSPLDSAEIRRNISRTNEILLKIREYNKFSIGDLLATMFKHSEKLDPQVRSLVIPWLGGNSRNGTRPAEIVDAIYRNPYSYTIVGYHARTAAFNALAIPEKPPLARSAGATSFLPSVPTNAEDNVSRAEEKLLYNAREGLEEWAARLVLWFVDREATSLEEALEPAGAPTWSKVEEFSLTKELPTMKSKAPVLWAVLTAVAYNKRRVARKRHLAAKGRDNSMERGGSNSSSSSGSSGSSNHLSMPPVERIKAKAMEKAEMAAVITIYMLIGFRNKMVGFFRSFTGIALFASNVHKSIFHVLNRLRISRAYSAVRKYLEQLAESAKSDLKALGRRAFDSMDEVCEDPQFFCFNFDNINQYVIPRMETVGNKSTMRNGTAATAIVLEDVPKGAFKRDPYVQKVQERNRQTLTVEALYEEIDGAHRARVGVATVMRILVKYIEGLKSHRRSVEALFQDPTFCAVHRLRLRKTKLFSFGTSGINEALVEGASDVLDDLCQQSGMEPEWFNNLLMLVGGDQLTVDRIRKAINHLDQEESIYHSKSWAIPLIQPWHMGWAYLKSLYRVHWFEATGKDTLGFRRSVGALGRNPNPEDYYPAEDALVTVFETMVLSASRAILRQEHGAIERTAEASKGFQLLEELERYFDSDGPLSNMDYLTSLANRIYDEYMTTNAYHSALSGPLTLSEPSTEDIKHVLNLKMRKLQLELDPTLGRFRNFAEAPEEAPTLLRGDQVLANGKLFMRDALEFVEFTSAMAEGDTGRLFKTINTMLFAFWGSKSTNYGSELLEIACKMRYEYPEALKEAIMNNYLVNPSGLPGKWQAGDFLQEHYNKDIKRIFNHKNAGFDDKFMRESISLNIPGFSHIKDRLLEILNLARTGKRRAIAKKHQDINVLAGHYEEERFFEFTPGRTQPYQAIDILAAGRTRLEGGALKSFLDRTLYDPGAVRDLSMADADDSQPEVSQNETQNV